MNTCHIWFVRACRLGLVICVFMISGIVSAQTDRELRQKLRQAFNQTNKNTALLTSNTLYGITLRAVKGEGLSSVEIPQYATKGQPDNLLDRKKAELFGADLLSKGINAVRVGFLRRDARDVNNEEFLKCVEQVRGFSDAGLYIVIYESTAANGAIHNHSIEQGKNYILYLTYT